MDKTESSRSGIPRLFHVMLLLLAVNPSLSAYTWGHPSRGWSDPDADGPPPKFEATPTSITALVGQTVYMPCRVLDLGDKVVSWIRTRDLHILTSGLHTYTSDARFEVLHKPNTDAWNLRIMGAQTRDEGKYECQVNTDPKINQAVFLTIRENDMRDSPYKSPDDRLRLPGEAGARPRAKVFGPREQFVHLGSTVTFTCLIEAPPPRDVNWFRNGRLVSQQSERGGINMYTHTDPVQTTSKLTVALVTHGDAGNYTCRASDVIPATVSLIIMEGEHTEAMQRDGGVHSAARLPPSCLLQCHLAVFVCILHWWRWRGFPAEHTT